MKGETDYAKLAEVIDRILADAERNGRLRVVRLLVGPLADKIELTGDEAVWVEGLYEQEGN